MKKIINLGTYLRSGGKFENIDFDQCKTVYYDQYRDLPVKSITPSNKQNEYQLYDVVYKNGSSHTYADTWIEINVDFILDPRYGIE